MPGGALHRLIFKGEEDSAYVELMNFRHYRDFDNGIIECKNKELMVAWTYTGVDHESASHIELNFLSLRLNDLLKSLGHGWVMWTEALRLETTDYPAEEDCFFPDEISLMIDRERRKAVQEQDAHFETIAFIVLMYIPPSKAKQKMLDAMIEQDEDIAKLSLDDKQLRYFNTVTSQFESALGSIFPVTRLRPYQDEHGVTYCDFLRLLHYCATGIMRPVRVPDPRIEIDNLICGQDFHPSFNPLVGENYVAIISVEGQHAFTTPAMLAEFDSRPLRYRWSTRFIFMDRVEAVESLDKYRRKWSQQVVSVKDQLVQTPNPRINLDAQRMVADLDEAAAEVSSGNVNQGLYNSVFIVYSNDLEHLQDASEAFKTYLNENGFGGRIETMNATSSFLGSIPGNAYVNVHKMQISTANLADLLPVASAWPGEEFAPCDKYPPFSPPLIQAETPNSTPFRFNLHVTDVGHTFMVGATGAGKSTLLCLIEVQMLKYPNAQVFAFDKGNSMFITCKGVGGNHYEIGSDGLESDNSVQMVPLFNIDTEADLLWAQEWVEACIDLQGVSLNPAKRTAIRHALVGLRESPLRTITEFRANLQDEELRAAMEYYVVGGPAGYILDGESETAVFNNFNVFEIGELMDLGEKVVIPTLLYLFRRIEKANDGRPTLLILDECWLMMDHPVFAKKLKTWLLTKRRDNVSVIMATNEIESAMESGLISTIMLSIATLVLLPNAKIADEQYSRFYGRTLGLNQTEIDNLARAIPKRQYYYRSVLGSRLFELNLRPKTLAFVGANSKEDIAKARAMMRDYPTDWKERWIEQRTA
ncbi:MAG: conjugal transfer protein TrbE [Granulosicoccus sp.]